MAVEVREKAPTLVSVYLPTKDRVDLLPKAVESVLQQTYPHLELIVVDDGSSDATAAYLAEVASRDPRIVVITHAQPCGAPGSRNEAILRSRGEFVTGLDDDDEFLPERIESFVAYWQLLQGRGVRPAFLYAQEVIVKSPAVRYVWRKAGHATAVDMYAGNYVGNQVYAPREHFVDAGLFDHHLPAWQDLELYLRMLERYGTGYLLDLATYVFNDSPRQDRISCGNRGRLLRAFEIIATRHAAGHASRRQKLWLQLFSHYNGLRPTFGDWWHFASLGFHLEGALHMLRAQTRGPSRFGPPLRRMARWMGVGRRA